MKWTEKRGRERNRDKEREERVTEREDRVTERNRKSEREKVIEK